MKRVMFLILVLSFSIYYICKENHERSRPRVVFCDVGQGDAVYLRLPEGIDVLVDAGPYDRVMDCLNEEMPLFDREIELAFLTHFQKDHYGGFVSLAKAFVVSALYLPRLAPLTGQAAVDWHSFSRVLADNGIGMDYLAATDQVNIGNSRFLVLGPNAEAGTQTDDDPNQTALALVALVGGKRILLMSDLDAAPAERLLEQLKGGTDIMKLNHHGSKYGTSEKLLWLAKPEVVVLSVGKNNFYGHPHPETLHLVESLNLPLRRTDKEGKIVIPL